jgi:hypothetical protein
MNRLDEVLLLSTVDPEFVISASETEIPEIRQFLTILDKTNDLWLIPGSKSELIRLGYVMFFKALVPPHYLIILISSDNKAMLETQSVSEIQETVNLLSNQLESMLKTPT